jgi:hypothetical protein
MLALAVRRNGRWLTPSTSSCLKTVCIPLSMPWTWNSPVALKWRTRRMNTLCACHAWASWSLRTRHVFSQTVDTGLGYLGGYTSLALDGSGYPHISYSYSGGGLKYAYHDASGWHIQIVDSEYVGRYTSLTLDGDGYPHISYHDFTNGNLKYAYQDGSGWHIQIVDSEGIVGSYTSLALDESGYPHISYYHCGTSYPCDVGDLKHAYQDTSAWHIETVDTGLGYSGGHASLALDGNGYPHISYHDYTNGDLKYTYYSTWELYLPLIRKGAS